MSDLSPSLGLPYLLPSQAQKHVTHNEALKLLDALVQLRVKEFDATTPPAVPVQGEVYALGVGANGAWAGQDGQLAVAEENGWTFLTPQDGWAAADPATGQMRVYTAGIWKGAESDMNNLTGVGVNTTYDAVNKLAVQSEAALFSHVGQGHQIKVNKAGVSDTASLLFQTNWSGRAEMGLAGNDDFSIKTSADGSSWTTALTLNAASGTASGAAVQNAPDDVTPGRLMRADYGYGPGNLLGPVSQVGGLPTGAVAETGMNANGRYVRYADGTQICQISKLVTAGAQDTFWYFPAAFAFPADPHRHTVTGTVSTSAGTGAYLAVGNVSNGTDIRVNALTGPGLRVVAFASLLAVGRWY